VDDFPWCIFRFLDMSKPPDKIDNAKVLEWAYSGEKPFGFLYYQDGTVFSEIYALAICAYENSDTFYRFSCNKNWECLQDSEHNSIEEAKNNIPVQYKNAPLIWNKVL
jgi:hypothetical protein